MVKNEHNSEKRLFIAIDIPGFMKDNIYGFAAGLWGEDRRIKLVPASNIHITLRFLGNKDISRMVKIEKAIGTTADSFTGFKYEIEGRVDAFPNLCNARVAFLKIGNGGRKISEIYNFLDDNLSRIKIRKEKRKFFPHITIARIKDKKNIEEIAGKHLMNTAGVLDCLDITLFESRLEPHGAEYTVINKFSLR